MRLFCLRCSDIGSSIHLGRRLQETGIYSISPRVGVHGRAARPILIRVSKKILRLL
jgi:hypothetical protein